MVLGCLLKLFKFRLLHRLCADFRVVCEVRAHGTLPLG